MHRGYIKAYRCLLDSGIVDDGPLLQVFVKALLEAAYKPKAISIFGGDVRLDPGEFIFGRTAWSQALNLSEKVVRNRIGTLQKRAIIKATKRASKFTVFKIVNWDIYQSTENMEGPAGGPAEGPTKGQQRASRGPHLKKERKKELKKEEYSASGDAVHKYKTKKGRCLQGENLDRFNFFWEAFDYKKGRAEAADAWYDLNPSIETAREIVRAAKREAEIRADLIREGRTPKMAQGWLSGRRWEDEVYEKPKPKKRWMIN